MFFEGFFFLQAMSERSREISIHKDMLGAQKKACESERQTLRYSIALKKFTLHGYVFLCQ